jgi:hypothetical protein
VLRDGDVSVRRVRGYYVDPGWLQGSEQSLEFDADELFVEAGDWVGWHAHRQPSLA